MVSSWFSIRLPPLTVDLHLVFSVEPTPSPQVTPVNNLLSNSLVTDLEGLSLSDAVLSPAVRINIFVLYSIFEEEEKKNVTKDLYYLFTDHRSLQRAEEL